MSVGEWFRTDFDTPVEAAAIPFELTSGTHPAIALMDQLARGEAIVGRALNPYAAVAVRLRGTGEPVPVTVRVTLDDVATRWWADRVRPSRLTPELPRVVAVRAQGRVRGALVLARRSQWRGAAPATATLGFRLDAGELAGDGLLIVELAEIRAPGWAAGRISPSSAIGLRIDGVRTGAPEPAAPAGFSGCDLVVLPPGTPATVRLQTVAVPLAPPVAISPRTVVTRRKPVRAAAKLGRIARRAAVRSMPHRPGRLTGGLRATDLATGADVPVRLEGSEVHLGAPVTGPVLLGTASRQPALSLRAT